MDRMVSCSHVMASCLDESSTRVVKKSLRTSFGAAAAEGVDAKFEVVSFEEAPFVFSVVCFFVVAGFATLALAFFALLTTGGVDRGFSCLGFRVRSVTILLIVLLAEESGSTRTVCHRGCFFLRVASRRTDKDDDE